MFGTKLLYDETNPGQDPLSPENPLIYTVGPITGSDVPCASRLCIVTKSPLTNALAVSLSGGFFPTEFKRTGFDALVITGKADEPVYIHIQDDKVSIKSATKYWGLNTFDTQMYIKEDIRDQNTRISCIGPAGENLSLISSINNEARVCGRKGVGAVMGSKNLKAVVVRGTNEVKASDSERLKKAISSMMKEFKNNPVAYPVFANTGSALAIGPVHAVGAFPSHNWQNSEEVNWDEAIGTGKLAEYDVKKNPCYKCPLTCSQVRAVKHGKFAGASSEGPEYESLYSLGSLLGIKSMEFIIAADRLCDELGFDAISAGCTVAMAMELFEKGIYTETDGLDLKFGNEEAAINLIRLMAAKDGVGAVYGDGSKKAAERIGKGSDYYAIHVKGLELPAYDVRAMKAQGLNYATAYTGADHNKGYSNQEVFGSDYPYPVERLEIKGKGILTKLNQDFASVFDTMTFCLFPASLCLSPVFYKTMSEVLSAITGVEYSEKEMEQVGERLSNLARLYNNREGFTRSDDNLPERIKKEELKFGLSKGEVISQADLDYMLDEYYEARGWDKNGVPQQPKLKELGLI